MGLALARKSRRRRQRGRPQGAVLRRAAGYCGTVEEFREVVLPWAARELKEGNGTLLIFRGERPAAFFEFPARRRGSSRLAGAFGIGSGR